MLTQMTAISDLGDTLMTHDQEANTTSLKMWVVSITLSTMSEVKKRLVSSTKYEISKIFKYNFNCESLKLITSLELTLFKFFIYSSTTFKSEICNDLKLELRLHLGKDLRKYKRWIEVVKCKDTGMYLRYIYVTRVSPWRIHEVLDMRMQ